MPAAKKSNRRRGPKKGKARRARRGGKNSNVPDMASLSVKRSFQTPQGQPGFNPNALYSLMNVQLLDYPRAVQVAAAYQHYRIKKVSVTFKPSFDTFAAAGASKPNLYWMVDKSGAIPTNATLEALKQMGARPKQLDENNIIVSYSPSVLESVMYASGGLGAASSSKYKVSPWLTTTAQNVSPGVFVANAVDHLGLYWYVDQLISVGSQYTIEVEVQFQFKKPLINLIGATEALKAEVATINDSPDGIVGGGDGI